MTISGYEILKCPFCFQLYKKIVMASYSSLDVKPYSDGYDDGIGTPYFHFPAVIKCVNKECGHFFNLNEAKVIEEISRNEYNSEDWEEAKHLSGYQLEASELYEALQNEFCNNSENEETIRILILRKQNDVFRLNRNHQLSDIDKQLYISNIDELIKINNNASYTNDKIFLAELYREKGDFNSCIELLNNITNANENEQGMKETIYGQAKVGDDKVFNIHSVAPKKEYSCNSCGHSIILFNIEIMKSSLEYKHYKCNDENILFNAPSKELNPASYYELNFFQKLTKFKKPYEQFILVKNISCPSCTKSNIEIFDPNTSKCIQCKNGNYKNVKWLSN